MSLVNTCINQCKVTSKCQRLAQLSQQINPSASHMYGERLKSLHNSDMFDRAQKWLFCFCFVSEWWTEPLSHCLCCRWDQSGGDGGAQGWMQTSRQWQLHEAEEVSEPLKSAIYIGNGAHRTQERAEFQKKKQNDQQLSFTCCFIWNIMWD